MSRRRKWFLIIVVMAILVVASLFGTGLLQLGINDTSQFYSSDGFHARGWFNQYSEVLDSSRYIVSVDDTGHSEKILSRYQWCQDTFSGTLTDSDSFDTYPNAAFLAQYLVNDVVMLNQTISLSAYGGQTIHCPGAFGQLFTGWNTVTYDTTLVGTATGKLQVNLWQHVNDHWDKLASDQAELASAAGSCDPTNIPTSNGYQIPYKPGQEVDVFCRFGYATSVTSQGGTGSWLLQVDGTTVHDLGSGPAFGGISSSFAAPTALGLHDIALVNSLWTIYTTHFSITVNPQAAPPPPVVSVDPPGPWLTGQTINLTWHASPSPVSNSPIKTVFYKIEYIDGVLILKGQSSNPTGSVQFNTGTRDVNIRTTVYSLDQAGEYSAPTMPVTLLKTCDFFVNCKGGGGGGLPFIIPLWAWLGIAAIVVFLLSYYLPVPLYPWKLLLVLIGIILVLLAVISFVVFHA